MGRKILSRKEKLGKVMILVMKKEAMLLSMQKEQ